MRPFSTSLAAALLATQAFELADFNRGWNYGPKPKTRKRRTTAAIMLGEDVQRLHGTPDTILKPKGKRARRRQK